MKRGLILSLLIFTWVIPFSILAEEPISPTSAEKMASIPVTDTSKIEEHFREVLARPEYQERDAPDIRSRLQEQISLWFVRLGARFGEFKYANRLPAFASLLMTLLVGFSLAGLLYTMFRLTRRRARMEEESAKGLAGPRSFLPPESYEQELHEAIHRHDWHRAWLTTWRQFLSRLEDRRLVEADRSRTNREYLVQLRARMLPAPALVLLSGMVDAYDRFIYGHRQIGEEDWAHFHQQIKEAALLLHLEDKVPQRGTAGEA